MADRTITQHLEASMEKFRARAVRDEAYPANHKGPRACLVCGGAIPKARLAALPTATLCVECQRLREQEWML